MESEAVMQVIHRSGITIKQYGKFHIRTLTLHSPTEIVSIEQLQVSLERENTEQELFIGYIRPQQYDFRALKQCVRFWLMEKQGQINQLSQWLQDAQDQQISDHMQRLATLLESSYTNVQQAFNEIDMRY